MIDRLTLLAPGDTRPEQGPALVLLDGQEYPAELFAPVAREVDSGPGVECDPTNRGPVFRLRHPEPVGTNQQLDASVLFFAGSDTDVKTQAPIARQCRRATFVVQAGQDESAAHALQSEKFEFIRNEPGGHIPTADVALLSSDWSVPRREFIRRCRAANIPTLTLQEAVNVDFDGPPHRMRWADAVCVSGPHALRYLQRDVAFLAGNPRYDGYRQVPMPSEHQVLINCNFILGLGGERGPAWMDQALNVVRELNLDYRITKHPRDDTDLTGIDHVLPSGAYKIAEQLAACSVLLTRDSSLAYEAILTGRPVIYFDPFHEKERTLREDDSGLIRKCDSREGLREALKRCAHGDAVMTRAAVGYNPYAFLFTEPGQGSARRVLRALQAISKDPDVYRTSDALVDSGWRSRFREWVELRARPRLRKVSLLRRAWRAARRRRS